MWRTHESSPIDLSSTGLSDVQKVTKLLTGIGPPVRAKVIHRSPFREL
jgi:hypothetical protein